MMLLKAATVAVTTTGAAGSGAGNADSDSFLGEIAGIAVNHDANAPTTTDITITDKRTGITIWALNNSKTDVYVAPRIGAVLADNTAILASEVNALLTVPYCVDQGVNVAIAGGNSITNHVVVTVYYRK